MADRAHPAVYTIPAHRAFADALVLGLLAQHGRDPLALARGIVLLPNNRAVRAIGDACVRHSGGGLLMPRLVPIGDAALDERLGNAFDPIGGAAADIPPAIGEMERQMILARLVQDARQAVGKTVDAGEAMRLAQALGEALDEMLIEEIAPTRLREIERSDEIRGELSGHWIAALHMLELVLDRWPAELAARGRIDLADRRNRLLRHAAQSWRETPPGSFVVAAGISSTAPAIAALMRTISRMERGQVVLAELDQNMSDEEWEAIGPFPPDPATGRAPRARESHPQFTLKLLLERMGIGREEVALWRWGGGHDARAERSRNISHAMLVPRFTGKWRSLPAAERTLRGVRAMEAATPAQEAQAIALLLREALETPERTAALVTPDRKLATRVSAHLRRWGIEADDSAGQPLSLLPPGTLLLAIARAVAERFAPVALLNLLKHPLVMAGEGRLGWLEQVRGLDLLLRGPRPAPGLAGLDALLAPRARSEEDRQAVLRARVAKWWPEARALLEPLEALGHGEQRTADLFAALRSVAGMLSADAVWAGHQGHAAARLFGEMEAAADMGPRTVSIEGLPDLLDRLLSACSVRPPQGGHPRIAIYGLIEARLQQADLMVLGGLNEGSWPGLPAPDPWLAPRIRQELGLPGLERRIGMAAHDFASGLGSPEVVITRSRRSENAPAVASRFWLRLQAITGERFRMETRSLALADAIDTPTAYSRAVRPVPCPPAALRPRQLSVTEVDRLKADPFSFYARRILRLAPLDPVDADPSAAWRGTAVHRILELWFREDGCDPARLEERALALMREEAAHPLLRALWQPRLLAAVRWIGEQVTADVLEEGRRIALVEESGSVQIAGVELTGKADRIDTLPDGSIAIVDYKTGGPPRDKQVSAGFALQLGLLGMIAQQGGFPGLKGARAASRFEYWSLAKRGDHFGYRASPTDDAGKRGKIATAAFVAHAQEHFEEAAARWLTGDEGFTALLHPELPNYGEYEQLMRLEEWYGRGPAEGAG